MRFLVLCCLLLSTQTSQGEEPGARAVFLRALDTMEKSKKASFVTDLSRFISTELEDVDSKKPEEIRTQRRHLVLGLAALFDSTDVLLENPFSRPFFQGIVKNEEERRRRRHLGGWVRFQGRNDAVAHFFLSAAVASIAGPVIAERLGHNKEVADAKRLDEKQEGEGFSFVDLAFNHSGIRFACWLTAWGDDSKLRRTPPPLSAFLPEFGDLELPDKLGWIAFQDGYWGEKVDQYDAVIASIRKALDTSLAAFESPQSK